MLYFYVFYYFRCRISVYRSAYEIHVLYFHSLCTEILSHNYLVRRTEIGVVKFIISHSVLFSICPRGGTRTRTVHALQRLYICYDMKKKAIKIIPKSTFPLFLHPTGFLSGSRGFVYFTSPAFIRLTTSTTFTLGEIATHPSAY